MPDKTKNLFSFKNPLLYILIFGLLLRLLFVWKGAAFYYGQGSVYENGDTFSYVLSFQNLVEKGHYTFDESIPDASFGRLPGFPFFYGFHYLVFGKDFAYAATAISQVLLDSLAILLIYLTILKLSAKRIAALIGSFLYATYPFIIVWVSIMGSELLANFFIVLYFYILVTQKKNKLYYPLLGITLCLAFYTREFLGIFVPITLLYIFITNRRYGLAQTFKNSFLLLLAFGILYLPWPIRNYVNHNRIMLVKTSEAGYATLLPDALGYFNFVNAIAVDNNFYFDEIKKDTPINFPEEVFKDEKDAQLAAALVARGRQCGSGLYYRKHFKKRPTTDHKCDEEVGKGFNYLAKEYKANNPLGYWLIVPLQKVKKALFKTQLIDPSVPFLKRAISMALFMYRSIFILIGILGLLIYRRTPELLPIIFYTLFIYFYVCFLHRSVEIRYFLQADVLLLIPASLLLGKVLGRFGILKLEQS